MILPPGLLRFLSPVRFVCLASLLLSLIAIWGTVTVPRDATLYFDTAQVFLDQGLYSALQLFDWPWFSVLLAATHWLTGLSLEQSGYFWCALFMAGTCMLLVDCCQRWVPGSGYLACLVALAVPGFNQYRGDILREFGFWFFCVLALWLAGRWRKRGSWGGACLIQLAVFMAAAFRLEAVFLLIALTVWALTERSWLRVLKLNLLTGIVALLALLSVPELSLGRLSYYQQLLNPMQLLESFDQLAATLAGGMRFKYSRDDAGSILFLGMVGKLLLDSLVGLGPLSLPILLSRGRAWREIIVGAARHFSLAWIGYFIILIMFFLHSQFMIARYESLLAVLAVPAAVMALHEFLDRCPRMGRVLLAVIVLVILDNVISLGAKKTQLVEAGHWMARNVAPAETVYYDDVRISYYAGRGARRQTQPREVAMNPENVGRFSYFFIEADPESPWLQQWLQRNDKRVLASFANSKGDAVLVLGD
ncbi:ArnT family glycosyltransferase [Stutzerimonas xanthomarina]|uniref:ArnT family glycosyltransferase n=1 Tax=Stutzerimonas xanthomarina TaxID=271420 RepID=UPI003AA93999